MNTTTNQSYFLTTPSSPDVVGVYLADNDGKEKAGEKKNKKEKKKRKSKKTGEKVDIDPQKTGEGLTEVESESAAAELAEVVVEGNGSGDPNRSMPADVCSICLEPLVGPLMGLECGHMLHKQCWRKLDGDKSKQCPLCRATSSVTGKKKKSRRPKKPRVNTSSEDELERQDQLKQLQEHHQQEQQRSELPNIGQQTKIYCSARFQQQEQQRSKHPNRRQQTKIGSDNQTKHCSILFVFWFLCCCCFSVLTFIGVLADQQQRVWYFLFMAAIIGILLLPACAIYSEQEYYFCIPPGPVYYAAPFLCPLLIGLFITLYYFQNSLQLMQDPPSYAWTPFFIGLGIGGGSFCIGFLVFCYNLCCTNWSM